MVETVTAHYGWTKPEVTKSSSTWGGFLNGDLDSIDALLWSINTQVQANTITISRGPDGGAYGDIRFNNNGNTQLRWRLGETSEAEGTGNAGTNLVLDAFDNSGAYLGNAFEAIRSTQTVAFTKAVSVGTTLYVSGAATVSGAAAVGNGLSVTGGITASGQVVAGTAIYPAYALGATDWNLTAVSGYRVHNWNANWTDRWNTASGTRDWTGPGVVLMTLDGLGNLSSKGDFTGLSGGIHSQAVAGGNANYWLTRNDGTNMGVVYYNMASVVIAMQNQIGGGQALIDGVANFKVNGNALKPGGGAWLDSSDVRIKTVTGSYSAGLDQVAKLKPVRFTYKGNDGDDHALVAKSGKEFIGLVADEAMQAMPEMVSLSEGEIDGRRVGDLKVLDPTALIYALVNSVKELKAEIEALKAR